MKNLLQTLLASVATHMPTHEVEASDDIAVVPDGYCLTDLEGFHERPRRIKQKVEAETLSGFLDYYNRYASAESVIFAREAALHIEAIFDYHGPSGEADWGDHRLVYDLPESDDWKDFTAKDGKRMAQPAFAEFIEEHEPLFVDPDGARMLEMARDFQANRNVDFASKINEHSGDIVFNYQEESKQKGQLRAPKSFTLALQPFRGSDKYEAEAKLRYRVSDQGDLTLWYDLVRPTSIVEDAFKKVLKKVKDSTEHGQMYRGQPK